MTQQPRQAHLTADAFIEWALRQPSRFELFRGEIVAMSPERMAHTRVKTEVLFALRSAIAGAALPCEPVGDGPSIRIDDATVYEPDAVVRCGPRTPNDAIELENPVIVVEVVSPSSKGVDAGAKLADYFRLASVRHYLVVHPEGRRVIHHGRSAEGGEIVTRVLGEEARLTLDPPGIDLAVADFFATL
jgi:Uma2 family endonuclease